MWEGEGEDERGGKEEREQEWGGREVKKEKECMERKMIGMRRGKERGQGWKGIEKQKGVGGGNEGTGVGSEGKWG